LKSLNFYSNEDGGDNLSESDVEEDGDDNVEERRDKNDYDDTEKLK